MQVSKRKRKRTGSAGGVAMRSGLHGLHAGLPLAAARLARLVLGEGGAAISCGPRRVPVHVCKRRGERNVPPAHVPCVSTTLTTVVKPVVHNCSKVYNGAEARGQPSGEVSSMRACT